MPKVKGKDQLCRCEKYNTYFKSFQGLGGYELFKRYDAIENIILSRIDEKYRHFLAQPIVDGDSITWFSKPFNTLPQHLSTLEGENRKKYEKIKTDTLNHFENTIHLLKQEGKEIEAEALEKAVKFVNDDFVYCYDDRVVLGIWGMQLREHIREPYGIAVKDGVLNSTKPTINKTPPEETFTPPPPEASSETNSPIESFIVRFDAGDKGNIDGISEIKKNTNENITDRDLPQVKAKEGCEFLGWDKDPKNHSVIDHVEFTAQYRKTPQIDNTHKSTPPSVGNLPKSPWYINLWNWLRGLFTGKGCLKGLLWLLFLLFIIFLFSWLFRHCHCNGGNATPVPYPIGDKPWINDDPNVGKGGIYNPGDPYKSVPTPPEYSDVLPPYQGTLPPIDSTKIIREPEKPVILGNRLNILMENENKSILDLAKEFKIKYPDEKYKVVYYDDVVKRMQVELPNDERERLKQEIPIKFAPEYELFVFDEALFEAGYVPNDPDFNDPNKSWYLEPINAKLAWDITRGAKKLTVAIVDNGFSLRHPELSGKVVMPYNVWTHSKDVFAQGVDHGTHVAGTALAMIDNGKGICGIAPECAFMPVQVANKQGLMTTTSMLDGILYALYQGSDVINISLGMQFTGKLPEEVQRNLQDNRFKEEERLWNEVLKISNKHKSTIVIAAGNDNMLAGIDPKNRPKNFIIVSAIDKNNRQYKKSGFSNYGDYSTISAPGVDIYSTVRNNSYTTMDGTSMAAPIVSGTIALMKTLNENLTSEQIICILQGTGKSVEGKIGNLIQIDKALQKVQSTEPTDCNSRPETPSTGDVQILLNWNNYNDLDLACVDPSGNTVWYKNKRVPSGGFLEIDMNVEANGSKTPIENIYWEQGKAPNGVYEVYLYYYKQHEPDLNETEYKITAKYGGKIQNFMGKIKQADGRKPICTFILGNVSNPRMPANPDNPPSPGGRKDNLLRERERLQKQIEDIDRKLNGINNNNSSQKNK
jgi:subtilisin family serine protease